MKRILLTGRNGQVGWELERTLAPLGQIIACDRVALDLADVDGIRTAVRAAKADIIVNAAAYTAVDKAEAEPALAMAVNGTAPGILAEEAKRSGALLVHYSTDYVFDGSKPGAYSEDDRPNPINAYGRSKLAGEQAIAAVDCRHLILRTSWVYGLRGQNFLRTMLRLAGERNELRVVDDQVGSPTWSRMIAEATVAILAQPVECSGIFHLTAAGSTSWHGFARAILDSINWTGNLAAIPTAAYPLPARRPVNSVLANAKLADQFALALPDWRDSFALCLSSKPS